MTWIKRIKASLYALGSGVNINLVGQFKVSEILVLLMFPFSIQQNDLKDYPLLRKIIYALVMLLCFQLLTDLFVVDNTPQNFLRGSASIIMPIISFFVIFKMFQDEEAIIIYIFFTVVKNIVFTDDIVDSDMSYFKFKIAPILSNIVYLLVYYFYKKGNMKLLYGTIFVYCVVCLANDTRSSALSLLISTVLIYFYTNVNVTRQKIIVFCVAGAMLFQGAYFFYVKSVLSHELGGEHSIEQLQRLENPYNPFELLITGRGETYVAMTAIGDKPWFGHGSWAVDKDLKYYKMLLAVHDEDLNLKKALEKDQLVPSHSILLGAWVNYGVGGFLAVFLIFCYLMKAGFYVIARGQSLTMYPIIVIMTVGLIWMFCFSPFQHLRYSAPPWGAMLLSAYYYLKYGEDEEEEQEGEENVEETAPENAVY
ncbi:MAG TPA: O-antigen ligase family protein [Chitinophaga sp.]